MIVWLNFKSKGDKRWQQREAKGSPIRLFRIWIFRHFRPVIVGTLFFQVGIWTHYKPIMVRQIRWTLVNWAFGKTEKIFDTNGFAKLSTVSNLYDLISKCRKFDIRRKCTKERKKLWLADNYGNAHKGHWRSASY